LAANILKLMPQNTSFRKSAFKVQRALIEIYRGHFSYDPTSAVKGREGGNEGGRAREKIMKWNIAARTATQVVLIPAAVFVFGGVLLK
jgi:hypothetical protein